MTPTVRGVSAHEYKYSLLLLQMQTCARGRRGNGEKDEVSVRVGFFFFYSDFSRTTTERLPRTLTRWQEDVLQLRKLSS